MDLYPPALATAAGGALIGFAAHRLGLGTPYVEAAVLGFAIFALTLSAVWRDRQRARATAAAWMRLEELLPAGDDHPADTDRPLSVEDRVSTAVAYFRRRAEDLLVRNRVHLFEQQRLVAALDRLPYGVVVTDAENRVVVWNRVAAAVLGADAEPCRGRPLGEVAPDLESVADEADATGRATLHARGDQHEREYMVQRHVIAADDRTAQGKIYTLRDYTQLRSSERAQSEFISQISHELKAPLNTIVAYVDALADPDLLTETERRTYFNNLSSETARLADLIGNLLKLSRIELGSLSANRGFVKPGTLVRGIAESFLPQAADRQQTLSVRASDTLRPVYGDKDLLGVALSNLITNALKYTPDGGRIEVTASEADDEIRITVTDTGVGIPEDFAPHVFERFMRSEQDDVVRVGGSGLGLSLVQEIVNLHHGSVSFESTEGSGTRFELRLPLRESGDQLQLAA